MAGKDKRVFIRVSEAELAELKAKAAARHLTVSAYVRMIVLSERGEK